MKKLLITGMALLCLKISIAQTNFWEDFTAKTKDTLIHRPLFETPSDDITKRYYDTLNIHREGKGSGKFSTDIKYLQNFLGSQRKVGDFENSLLEWGSLSKENGTPVEVSYGYNSKTGKHDIPCFKVCYAHVLSDKTDMIWVEYGLNRKIEAIEFKIEEDQLDIDKTGRYIERLKANGYSSDIGRNRLSRRLYGNYGTIYCKNTAMNIGVSITPIDEYTTKIRAFRLAVTEKDK